MNYQKVYSQLIAKARSLNRQKLKRDHPDYVYYESHHIVPVCMGGEGKASQWKTHPNIILLTPREHFLAHLLLVNVYPHNIKLTYTLLLMCGKKKIQSSKLYHRTREAFSELSSKAQKGKKLTEAHRKALSIAHTGEKHTKERREKKSIAQGGENHWTRKKVFTKEARENQRKAQKALYENGYINPRKGKKLSEEEKAIHHPIVQCPYCKVGIRKQMATRVHFEKCKSKTKNMRHKAIIAIDFDGTVARTTYPLIHGLKEGARDIINKLFYENYYIIINTCRSGEFEVEVEVFLKKNRIKYHLINNNHSELKDHFGADCRKISADFYIDDRNIDALYRNAKGQEGIDWLLIYEQINFITKSQGYQSSLDLLTNSKNQIC